MSITQAEIKKEIFCEHLPTVSVIIPVRNEELCLEPCLRSILSQEPVAGGFEVLVVDGMSNDGTREIIQEFCKKDSRLRLLDNPKCIVPSALNIGVLAATGKIIIRMDAHTEYAPDYIYQCVQVLRETGASNVGGPHMARGASRIQKAIALAHHSFFAVGGALSHNVNYEGYVDTVIYGCWQKDTILRLGLFDEELVRNQDDEFNLRLIRAGGKIWQSPRIRSWYQPRASLRALSRQYWQYGYWKVRVIQKHRIPAAWRHLVPAAFVAALAGNLLLLPFFSWAFIPLSIMVASYLGANLTASVLTAKRADWSLLPVLPLVFVCYHFAYGLGFLQGVLDFLILRRQAPDRMKVLTR